MATSWSSAIQRSTQFSPRSLRFSCQNFSTISLFLLFHPFANIISCDLQRALVFCFRVEVFIFFFCTFCCLYMHKNDGYVERLFVQFNDKRLPYNWQHINRYFFAPFSSISPTHFSYFTRLKKKYYCQLSKEIEISSIQWMKMNSCFLFFL